MCTQAGRSDSPNVSEIKCQSLVRPFLNISQGFRTIFQDSMSHSGLMLHSRDLQPQHIQVFEGDEYTYCFNLGYLRLGFIY